MSNNKNQQKIYHKKASGSALATVRKHSKDNDLKLFGSCFWLVFLTAWTMAYEIVLVRSNVLQLVAPLSNVFGSH
jgi:hypothetical protein